MKDTSNAKAERTIEKIRKKLNMGKPEKSYKEYLRDEKIRKQGLGGLTKKF